jgi:hypothetical protein
LSDAAVTPDQGAAGYAASLAAQRSHAIDAEFMGRLREALRATDEKAVSELVSLEDALGTFPDLRQ